MNGLLNLTVRFYMIRADICAQINAEWYFQCTIQENEAVCCQDAYTLSGYQKKEIAE